MSFRVITNNSPENISPPGFEEWWVDNEESYLEEAIAGSVKQLKEMCPAFALQSRDFMKNIEGSLLFQYQEFRRKVLMEFRIELETQDQLRARAREDGVQSYENMLTGAAADSLILGEIKVSEIPQGYRGDVADHIDKVLSEASGSLFGAPLGCFKERKVTELQEGRDFSSEVDSLEFVSKDERLMAPHHLQVMKEAKRISASGQGAYYAASPEKRERLTASLVSRSRRAALRVITGDTPQETTHEL